MNKKRIMYFLYIINISFLIYLFCIIHMIDCSQQIISNHQEVTISIPENKSINSTVDFLIDKSNDLNIEIIYGYANQGKGYTYYTTSMSETDCTLSSSPGKGEKRLNGFYEKSFIIELKSFDKILNDNIYTLTDTFYVDTSKIDILKEELNKYDISLEVENSFITEGVDSVNNLFLILGILIILFIISAIFYVFSRSREYSISKGAGFSNYQNMIKELKNTWVFFVCAFLCLCFITATLTSILYGLLSAFNFFKLYIISIFIFCILLVAVLAAISYYVSTICGVAELKGKTKNKVLMTVASIIKLVVIIMLMIVLSMTLDEGYKCFKNYSTMKRCIDILGQYGRTEYYVGSLDFENEYVGEYYADALLDYYNLMDERKGVIFVDLEFVDRNKKKYGSSKYGFGDINANYLDEFSTVYKTDGTKLSSKDLSDDMINILIPEGIDNNQLPRSRRIDIEASDCKINYIKYSPESRFFTFNIDPYEISDGFEDNIIVEVINPELLMKYLPKDEAALDIASFFMGKAFFKYDPDGKLSPYEQISDILEEAGLYSDTFYAEKAEVELYEMFTILKQRMIFHIMSSILLLFALIVLCVNTTLLYYMNHKKKIFTKIINGYSFIDVFKRPIAIKVYELLILVLCGFASQAFLYVSIYSVICSVVFCFVIDSLLFYVFMKLYMKNGNKRGLYE